MLKSSLAISSLFLLSWLLLAQSPPQKKSEPPLAERKGDLSVMTWNLGWFYDWDINDNQSETAKINSAPSRAEWEWRLHATTAAIAKVKPTVLCLQEIENRKVLDALCAQLKTQHQLNYEVCFAQGRDSFTEQDVGILVLRGLRPQYRRAPEPRIQEQRRDEKSITKQIMLELPWGEGASLRRLTIINVHLMAGDDVGKEMDRCDQARFMKRWIRDEHRRGHYVILVGDMNTAEMRSNNLKERAIDVLTGKDTDDKDDDLEDLVPQLPILDRITFPGRGSTLDHILISPKLKTGPGLAYDSIRNRKDIVIRGEQPDSRLRGMDRRFWKVPQDERDLSDHYPLQAIFKMKP